MSDTSPLCELVLRSKNCRGCEPLETLESDRDYVAFQNAHSELKELEERFSKIPKSQTVGFLIDESFARVWKMITTPKLERLLDSTIEAPTRVLRALLEEDLHREVTVNFGIRFDFFLKR